MKQINKDTAFFEVYDYCRQCGLLYATYSQILPSLLFQAMYSLSIRTKILVFKILLEPSILSILFIKVSCFILLWVSIILISFVMIADFTLFYNLYWLNLLRLLFWGCFIFYFNRWNLNCVIGVKCYIDVKHIIFIDI